MPSNAHTNWTNRINEITQLIEAHGALVRFKRAEAEIAQGGTDFRNIGRVVDALVSDPTAGRPPQVQALNSSAIALLSAHLQGYIVDLFEEACGHLLNGKVPDHSAVISTAPTQGNPNLNNINRLFEAIGIPRVLSGISWRGMSNDSLKRKLREFNELRNRIVHGNSEVISKSQVENYLNVWTNLAKQLDRKVHDEINGLVGNDPWPRD